MNNIHKGFSQRCISFGSGLLIGGLVMLSGEAAAVSREGNNLTYQWRLMQQPSGSALVIQNADAVAPNFSKLKSGRYTFELMVEDPVINVVRVPATGDGLQVGPFDSADETPVSRVPASGNNQQQAVSRSPAGAGRSASGGFRAETVITSILLETDVDQKNAPVTFGQIFVKGDVPAGVSLNGHLEDGSSVELQVDRKATYDDGSLRHAIISTQLNTLTAGKTQRLGLVLAAEANSTRVITATQLANLGFQASIEVVIGGKLYVASPIEAMKSGAYKNWLSGGIANEWIVVAPFKTGAGVEHPHLMGRFYIRAYAGGKIRVSTVVENNWTFEASPSNLTYNVNVKIGGRSVYRQNALTHYHHARWRKLFWVDGQYPKVSLRHNAEYMMASKAIPNYDRTLKIPESDLVETESKWKQGKGIMDVGLATHYMPSTGAHDDIGPLPMWTVRYLLSMDPRAKQAMMGTGRLAGSWSMHYRDRDTGLPVSLNDHPYISTHSNLIGRPIYGLSAQQGVRQAEYLFNQSYDFPQTETEFWQGETHGQTAASMVPLRQVDFAPVAGSNASSTPIAACQGDCTIRSGYQADTAHQPSLSYVPYMVSGDYYHLEELQFWANSNMLATSPASRGNEKGLLKWQQVRGQAWSMRTLGDAAFITPDDDPMKAYFMNRVKHNLDFYNANLTHNANANKLGFVAQPDYSYQFPYNKGRAIAPWQDDFFTWSIGHLAELGFEDALPLLHWKAKFPVGRMTNPGYCWAYSAAYTVNVRDSRADEFYTSFAKMYENAVPATVRQQACASQAMIDANNAFVEGGTPRQKWDQVTDSAGNTHWEPKVIWYLGEGTACVDAKCTTLYDRWLTTPGEIGGIAASPAGFPSNMQPALAVVADFGVTQGRQAWSRFESRAIKPDYSSYPNWAIVPR